MDYIQIVITYSQIVFGIVLLLYGIIDIGLAFALLFSKEYRTSDKNPDSFRDRLTLLIIPVGFGIIFLMGAGQLFYFVSLSEITKWILGILIVFAGCIQSGMIMGIIITFYDEDYLLIIVFISQLLLILSGVVVYFS